MADLRGSLLANDPDPDDSAMPTTIDTELLREHTGEHDAFVEELQESLRPLYVLWCQLSLRLGSCGGPSFQIISDNCVKSLLLWH